MLKGRKTKARSISDEEISYAVAQRLRLIELLVMDYGTLNRSSIMKHFGIKEACASRDIRLYDQLAPDNLLYCVSSRQYVKAPNFKPHYTW